MIHLTLRLPLALVILLAVGSASARKIADAPREDTWQIESLRGDCVADPAPSIFYVWDIAPTANAWFVGGSFRMIRDPANDPATERFRPGICRFTHDGLFDAAFDPFGSGNDQFKWAPDDPEDPDFVFDDINTVALAPAGDRVYIGGRFNLGVNPSPLTDRRRHLAALDPANGRVLAWDPNVPTLVRDIVVSSDGERIYVGYTRGVQAYLPDGTLDPSFPTLTMQRRTQDFTTCTFVGDPVDDGARALALDETTGTLYVAGSFTSIALDDGVFAERQNVAAIDLTTNELLPFQAEFCNNGTGQTNRIIEIVLAGGFVYLAGDWWQTRLADGTWSGCHERQRNINRFDRYTGALDDSWLPWSDGGVQGLAIDRTRNIAIIPGHFDRAGVVDPDIDCDAPYKDDPRRDLMAVSLCDGAPLPWRPGSGGCFLPGVVGPSVFPAAIEGATLALGGPFQSTGGIDRTGLAFYDLLGAACLADLDHNGAVDFGDLLFLLSNWATAGCADLTGDGAVAFDDLLLMLGTWGDCG